MSIPLPLPPLPSPSPPPSPVPVLWFSWSCCRQEDSSFNFCDWRCPWVSGPCGIGPRTRKWRMALVSAVLGTCRSWPSSTGDRCSPFASKPCAPLACQLRSLLLHRSASAERGKEEKKKKGIRCPDEGGRIVTNDRSINWIERIKLKKKKEREIQKFFRSKEEMSSHLSSFLCWIDRVCVQVVQRLKRAGCC